MIGGLDKPSTGKVYIDEVDIAQLDAYELAWLRNRKIGYIFQTFNLIQVMTALENVTLPMIFAGLSNERPWRRAWSFWAWWGFGNATPTNPTNSPAASSSGWPSPAPWPTPRPSSWPTSPPATWT
jgi:ABC-type lipoprotein export system ATPase subunit